MNKEEAYDDLVKPLMQRILEIVRAFGIEIEEGRED